MARTVNFVRDRQRNLSLLEVQDRKVFKWAIIATAIAVALVMIVVGARLLFLFQLRQITADQKRLKEAISSKEEIEKSFTVFSHKLKVLTELFGKRKEKQETLEYFSNLFDKDVIISQLSYSSESEELSFTLQAKSVFVMKQVMETLNSDEVQLRYPRMVKASLGRTLTGSYTMNLSVPLSEKPITEVQAEAVGAGGVDEFGVPIGQPEPAAETTPTEGI
jgi:flagellar basal body-associated protein FliL